MVETTSGAVSGARIAVIGINYAPEVTGIAPYTSRAASYLSERGAEVFVLTGIPHYPSWRIPDSYRHRLRVDEEHDGVSLRRLRHYVPRRQTALGRSLYEVTFGAHAAVQRLPWQPDVVLAVVPSLLGAVAAVALARRTGARLAVWVQDLMGPAARRSGISGGGLVAAATSALERFVLTAADEVLVLNEAFHRYATRMGVKPSALYVHPNWTHIAPPSAPVAATRARLGWRSDEVIALHSGNMGLKQRLVNVVGAATLAAEQGLRVRFVLMGDGSQRALLQRVGTGLPNLGFLPPAGDDDFVDILAAADVLLVNERASVFDMSLPSKLTSYFRAGRPVVAAVHPEGGTAALVKASGAGVVTAAEDPAALLSAVRRIVRDPDVYAAMCTAATQYATTRLDERQALDALGRRLVPAWNLADAAVSHLEPLGTSVPAR